MALCKNQASMDSLRYTIDSSSVGSILSSLNHESSPNSKSYHNIDRHRIDNASQNTITFLGHNYVTTDDSSFKSISGLSTCDMLSKVLNNFDSDNSNMTGLSVNQNQLSDHSSDNDFASESISSQSYIDHQKEQINLLKLELLDNGFTCSNYCRFCGTYFAKYEEFTLHLSLHVEELKKVFPEEVKMFSRKRSPCSYTPQLQSSLSLAHNKRMRSPPTSSPTIDFFNNINENNQSDVNNFKWNEEKIPNRKGLEDAPFINLKTSPSNSLNSVRINLSGSSHVAEPSTNNSQKLPFNSNTKDKCAGNPFLYQSVNTISLPEPCCDWNCAYFSLPCRQQSLPDWCRSEFQSPSGSSVGPTSFKNSFVSCSPTASVGKRCDLSSPHKFLSGSDEVHLGVSVHGADSNQLSNVNKVSSPKLNEIPNPLPSNGTTAEQSQILEIGLKSSSLDLNLHL